MVDLFGIKRRRAERAALETQRVALETQISSIHPQLGLLRTQLAESQRAFGQSGADYQALHSQYLTSRAELETAEGTIQTLEARLRPVPNHEIITFQAIRELAGAKSDEGYDAFLKDMIGAVVDKGVTAYEDTLSRSLRRNQTYSDHFPMVMIPKGAGSYYAGFKVLDEVAKPAVDFIGMEFPNLERKTYSLDVIANSYGSSDPQVVLRFRTENDARHASSRADEKAILNHLLPTEWQAKLEADKKVLLQAFGFGFAASYYEDVHAHPELPVTVSNYSGGQKYEAPKMVLEVQERAGLMESKTLLQDLYECVQATHPKFSASVLGYFNR